MNSSFNLVARERDDTASLVLTASDKVRTVRDETSSAGDTGH